jgi:hypothetical protein
MQEWKAAATPRVLDEGEVRLILDSRTLGAAGAAGRAATHVEVVVEFAVQAPALGKPLPGRIVRRPLAPAEALGIVALLAAALEEALDAGYSHGWLTAASAWNLRRRACLVDMVAGLAMPDDEQVEVAEQVSGYFAPERIAGGAANEAADVFALGWMLYASLVGNANLDGYYAETVAAAGSASTAELLALWRERSREHVRGLLAEDSALAVLLLGALAERPADRPTLAAFRAAATEAAHALAGAAALVIYQPKKRPAAAVAGAVVAGAIAGVAAMEAAELIAAESAESTSESTATNAAEAESTEAVGAGALAAAGVAGLAVGAVAMEALLEAEDTGAAANLGSAGQTGAAGYAAAQGSGAGVEHAAAGGAAAAAGVEAGTASSSEFEAAAMESSGAGAGYAEASFESSGAGAGHAAGAAGAGHAAGAARRRRPRMGAGLLVACGMALLAIGLGSGYAFGASSSHASSSSMANTKSGIVLGAAGSATGAACAPSASASTSGAVVAAAPASVVASASTSAASAAWDENAALPLPTSTAAAVSQLNQIVQGAESSGLISGATASTLRGEVTAVQQAIASGAGLSTAWTQLSSTIQSGQAQGTIPQALSLQLNSALSYLSSAAGS